MSSFVFSAALCGLLSLVAALPIFPLRVSLIAYLVAAHLNLSGQDFASASALGIENALRIIILPTILLMRTRFAGFKLLKKNLIFRLWIVFGIYVSVASFWSPFTLSAVKQIGYLYAYTVGLLVFAHLYHKDKALTYRIIAWSLVSALILAFIQTFLMGNLFSNVPDRLTSFRGAQSFGLYLALMLAILLSFPREQTKGTLIPRSLIISFALLGLFLNGSRTGFIAFLFAIVFSALFAPLAHRSLRSKLVPLAIMIAVMVTMMAAFVIIKINPATYQSFLQSHRSLQALNLVGEKASFEDIDTARFRLEMYQTILMRLREKSMKEILLGSGTSSIGEIIALGYFYYRGLDEFTVDANRLAHSEFFRALYEWGIAGSILFISLIVALLAGAIRIARRSGVYEAYMLLGILFVIMVLLMTQNILAASSAPIGTALILYLAQLVCFHLKIGARPNRSQDAPVAVVEKAEVKLASLPC